MLLGWHRIDVPGATGYLDTDYAAKGRYAVEALGAFDLVCVHVEAPDEASHMGDRRMKVETIAAFDRDALGPPVAWLRAHRECLGGVLLAPDHYTNHQLGKGRADAHSLHPVPFCLWNGVERDGVLYVPDTAEAGAPVLLFLHGASGSGRAHLRAVLAAADRYGVVLVAPDSRHPITWDLIADGGFEYLDGPVKRLAGPDVPAMPFSHPMQEFFMPNPDKIADAIRELAGY